jgi:hypothetical protein
MLKVCITIIWIVFLVFALNVVTIYLALKDVKVSCYYKVVKLSYIIIIPFGPFTLIVKCVIVSMFKNVLLNVHVLKCVSLKHNMWVVLKLQYKKISFLCKGNDLE